MTDRKSPIGVFDSGVGGVSVLRELVKIAPNENIIYFGDSENAPYGEKDTDTVRELTYLGVKKLLGLSAKAIVVACNTATGAAVRMLREDYPELPIVGIEPAIKPAVLWGETEKAETGELSRVLVMATPVTISQSKFAHLTDEYGDRAEIIPLPCPRLAELIEKGDPNSEEIAKYVEELLSDYACVDSVVLGCTHYPFIKHHIEKALPNARVFDGGEGTAREALRRIRVAELQNTTNEKGNITFISSKGEAYAALYRRFFEMKL